MKLKHYLIASEENNYRPWIMTPTALGCFCLAIWGLRVFLPVSDLYAAPTIDPTDLMNRVNQERTNRFIPALATNSKLMAAANLKSNDMIARSYFAHVDPDGKYVWPTIESQGYTPYKTLGENLAMDFTDAASMITAWMNSPTHRENLLNEKFEDQGMASVYGEFEPGHDSILATNLFGTLYKQTPPPPPPAPKPNPPPAPQPTPKPNPVPNPQPIPVPTPTPTPTPNPVPIETPQPTPPVSPVVQIQISDNVLAIPKIVEGKTIVELNVYVGGSPQSVVAKIDTLEVKLNENHKGEYTGEITLATASIKGATLSIEAQDGQGNTVIKEFPLTQAPAFTANIGTTVASEAQLSRTLKIILGVFSALFLFFLIIDSIIIFRAKITRNVPSSSSHSVIMFLIAIVNIFTVLYK
jgi:hypothetical protein